MREIAASAPGKVNLVLRSGPQGEDGFHQLFSVFEAISLREYVVARTRRKPGVGVKTYVYRPGITADAVPTFDWELTEQMGQVPVGQHLAVRAAKALQPLAAASGWGPSSSGVDLTVHKCIPAAGGMAGGSADAAATLVAVNELWQLGLIASQLEQVGRQLGADVPACLRGGWSMGVEHGDHLSTLTDTDSDRHWWALAFADQGLSTPSVFREFDRLGLGVASLPTELGERRLALMGPATLASTHLENNLAAAALSLRPELAQVGQSSLDAGALAWMVSGSGPTIAALAPDREVAANICRMWRSEALVSSAAVTFGPGVGSQLETGLPNWVR